jgi:hypothetical protein
LQPLSSSVTCDHCNGRITFDGLFARSGQVEREQQVGRTTSVATEGLGDPDDSDVGRRILILSRLADELAEVVDPPVPRRNTKASSPWQVSGLIRQLASDFTTPRSRERFDIPEGTLHHSVV